jgi:hypothetical protein
MSRLKTHFVVDFHVARGKRRYRARDVRWPAIENGSFGNKAFTVIALIAKKSFDRERCCRSDRPQSLTGARHCWWLPFGGEQKNGPLL